MSTQVHQSQRSLEQAVHPVEDRVNANSPVKCRKHIGFFLELSIAKQQCT